jgi:hypothetical protein
VYKTRQDKKRRRGGRKGRKGGEEGEKGEKEERGKKREKRRRGGRKERCKSSSWAEDRGNELRATSYCRGNAGPGTETGTGARV